MHPAERGVQAAGDRAGALVILMSLRAVRWSGWVLPVAICVVAAAVDGFMVRRRRSYGFDTPLPPLYNAAAYAFISALMVLPLLVAAPFAIPIIAPAAAMTVVAAALWMLCAHFPGPGTLIAGRR